MMDDQPIIMYRVAYDDGECMVEDLRQREVRMLSATEDPDVQITNEQRRMSEVRRRDHCSQRRVSVPASPHSLHAGGPSSSWSAASRGSASPTPRRAPAAPTCPCATLRSSRLTLRNPSSAQSSAAPPHCHEGTPWCETRSCARRCRRCLLHRRQFGCGAMSSASTPPMSVKPPSRLPRPQPPLPSGRSTCQGAVQRW